MTDAKKRAALACRLLARHAEHREDSRGSLWLAVLLRAVMDSVVRKRTAGCRRFFASRWCEKICGYAGLDPTFVRETMTVVLANDKR